MNSSSDTVTHIYPSRKWTDVDIRILWKYRDVFYMYVRRYVVTYYTQTIFGPLWYMIQPVLTTIMYLFVFGTMAHIPTDGIPGPLFYLSGIALWNYCSQCFISCSNVFGSNAGVFGKVWFPRLLVPLASCTSGLIRFGIQILVFVAVYIYYAAIGQFDAQVDIKIMAVPLLVLFTGAQAMALGLICSSWTVKYKDLKYTLAFFIQLAMYATPVIYPLSFAPERYRWIMNLNPMTPVFEAFKYCCLGTGTFNMGGLIYSFCFLCVTLILSVLIFNKAEEKFIDTI